MRLWIIDKINSSPDNAGQEDFFINFTCQKINHSNLLELSEEYNSLRKTIKEEYIKFVADLGNIVLNGETLKELFQIENCSLWWFNRISLKDSFSDSLFDDLCKTVFINRVITEKGIKEIIVLSNSPWLEHLLRIRKLTTLPTIMRSFISRIKLVLFYYSRIKVFLFFFSKWPKHYTFVDTLFNTYFPGDWNKSADGRYSDRFFRDLPSFTKNSGYLMFLERCRRIPDTVKEPVFIIQRYIGFFDIIISLADIRNFFRYLINRREIKKHFKFKDIDLSGIYDLYFWQVTILDELFFRLIIKGVGRITQQIKPKQILTVGEFGIETKATIAGGKSANASILWLQHEVISEWKLWYFNHSSEIYRGNHAEDFLLYMPVADTFIVWGKQSVEIMKNYGYPLERMVVLGNQRYDSFIKNNPGHEGEIKSIIFTPTIDTEETLIFGDAAIKIKKCFTDKNVILKLHPRYSDLLKNKEVYKICALAESEGVQLITENVEKFYNRASLFICGLSSVAIESAYFGIKTIIYQSKYYNRFTPEWREEACQVSTAEELVEKIRNYKSIRPLNWSKYYLPPGNIKNRVAEFLEDKVNKFGV